MARFATHAAANQIRFGLPFAARGLWLLVGTGE